MRRILGGLLFAAGMGGLIWLGWTDRAADMRDAVQRGARDAITDSNHPLVMQVTGRDVRVSGLVDSIEAHDALVTRLSAVEGLRDLDTQLEILPRIAPYRTQGVRHPDGGIVLSGAAPTEAARIALGDIADALDLAFGAPDRWLAIAGAGQAALSHLHEGRWQLTDNSLSLTGVARSEAGRTLALETLSGLRGVKTNAAIAVIPLADPWITTGVKSGLASDPIQLNGYAPRQADLSPFRALSGAEGLIPADGAPDLWSKRVASSVAALGHLARGEFALTKDGLMLSGIARTRDHQIKAEEALRDEVEVTTDIVVVPLIVPYRTEASKNAEGEITFSGFAPSHNGMLLLGGGAGALSRADGAPADWDALAEAGQTALAALARGGWLIEGDRLIVDGVARSEALRNAALGALGAVDPTRMTSRIAILPLRDPYTFRAIKRDNSAPVLSGAVPPATDPAEFGPPGADLIVAEGAPPDWTKMVRAALGALDTLARGELAISGQNVHLVGIARSPVDRDAAVEGLALGLDWIVSHEIDVRLLADPFRTGALKTEDGAPVLTGHVPGPYGVALLGLGADRDAEAETALLDIADGAPGNWEALAEAGDTALRALAYGGWQIEGDRLTVSGIARDAAARAKVQAAVADVMQWTRLDITLRARIDPFVTGAEKDITGAWDYSGFAPPGAALPGLTEADGAPDDWFDVLREAQAALEALESGRFLLNGRQLRVIGVAADAAAEMAVTDRLSLLEGLAISTEIRRAPPLPEAMGADVAPAGPKAIGRGRDGAPRRPGPTDPRVSTTVAPPDAIVLPEHDPDPVAPDDADTDARRTGGGAGIGAADGTDSEPEGAEDPRGEPAVPDTGRDAEQGGLRTVGGRHDA